ncbi:MAG: succinylglutamate desuccinylase/aspartoacylase family protein [Alphaproteobacteria bacterium]|nr:succinylglutamate desuccinylase/aspartoacylase family protein [Alphaproteobacteria bacterium]
MKINKYRDFVGTTPMGTELNILRYEIDSEKEGHHIYIQSGIHGGEITQWIAHELFLFIKKNLHQGKVTLVPCANPVSWTQRAYYSTNGKFDFYMGKDWNRNFPGNSEGSMGEKIAAVLFENAKKADFVLDLHTSRESIPFAIYSRPEYEDILKIIAIKYNQFIDMQKNSSYSNTMNACLDKVGVNNLCIECGSHDAYEPNNIREVVNGIKRLFSAYEMIDSKFTEIAPNEIKTFAKTVKYTSPMGCLIRLAKPLGAEIKKGDDLFYCFDNNNLGSIVAVQSKHDGVLFKASPTHIYWSGDDVVQLLLNEDTKPLTTVD